MGSMPRTRRFALLHNLTIQERRCTIGRSISQNYLRKAQGRLKLRYVSTSDLVFSRLGHVTTADDEEG